MTVRGSSLTYVNNSASASPSLPAAAAAGDLCYCFVEHGYQCAFPTGWRPLAFLPGANVNGATGAKVLTSADISAGTVSLTFPGGAYYGVVTMVAMVGNPTIRAIAASRNASSASTRTVTTDTSPQSGDDLLLFGSARVNSAVTSSSLSTTLQSNTQSEASSITRSGTVGTGGAQSGVLNYSTVANSGDYQVIIALTTTTSLTSYTNTGGAGNRSSIITVAATNIATGGGSPGDVVDGSQSDSYWWSNATGDGTGWLRFDFGAAKIIDQFCVYQDNPGFTHGTWRLEGSNDASSWTQCGADLTLGHGAFHCTNSVGYRYYRLRHMSGARSQTPYIREIEFQIGDAVVLASGAGAASAAMTASGVGAATKAAAGAAAVTATATGVGAATKAAAGAAAVTVAATGAGGATAAGAGSAAGAFSAAGVGGTIVATDGAAGAVFAAAGVGASIAASAGAASISSAVSGAGATETILAGAGAASISISAAGTGSSEAASVGLASVTLAAGAIGGAIVEAVGTSEGALTAAGAGSALVAAAGVGGYLLTASAVGEQLELGIVGRRGFATIHISAVGVGAALGPRIGRPAVVRRVANVEAQPPRVRSALVVSNQAAATYCGDRIVEAPRAA